MQEDTVSLASTLIPTVHRNVNDEKLMHKASSYGDLDTIMELIEERGTEPTLPDAVSHLINSKTSDRSKQLLQDGNQPIHLATVGGHLNVVQALVEKYRVNPDLPNNV